LLIRNKNKIESEDIFPYIKEYIMKKKRVKYLSITGIDGYYLFFMKDEVEELKLHGIQVKRYNNLLIDIEVFIKSL
jgi:hypothetical protein